MKKLTTSQLDSLRKALNHRQPHPALKPELLDHLASQIEQLMNQGLEYENALQQVMLEASPQAVAELKHSYQQFLSPLPISSRRLPSGRYRKRQQADRHHPTWLRASVVAFLTLMICLMWCSQLFAVPLEAFMPIWVLGLTGLLGAYFAKFVFRPRLRSLRHRWI